MPLKGTPREQKHYREIREKYPEKGKEYAARVARNIVRANTPGGRKLKGTTEYGRSWGPPYSEPLSKKGEAMFYKVGQNAALEKLGFIQLTPEAAAALKSLWGGIRRGGARAGEAAQKAREALVGGPSFGQGIIPGTATAVRDVGAGLLARGRGALEGAQSALRNMTPEQLAMLKRLGIGAGVGGIAGGVTGGEMGGGTGAVLGALGGAGLGALGGQRLGQRMMRNIPRSARAAYQGQAFPLIREGGVGAL